MPAAARLAAENDLDAEEIEGTGPGGRILKEDVQREIDGRGAEQTGGDGASVRGKPGPASKGQAGEESSGRETETVPMSPCGARSRVGWSRRNKPPRC
jgi:2-oxoglutarate dehydrogenase E2 component (dihydrolipoamide succinyltransferase)